MKSNILTIAILFFVATFATAQDDKKTTPAPTEKTQKEKDIDQSLSNIKKELEKIKSNVDSAKLREIAKTLEKSADEIASQIEVITEEIEEKADKLDEKYGNKDKKSEKKSDNTDSDEDKGDIYNKDKKGDKKLKNPFDFKEKKPKVERRTKTYFEVQTGLNGLVNGNGTAIATRTYPKLNTWSWYFDYGLKWKTRIGRVGSPASVNYGISYLRNKYRFENDTKISLNPTGNPVFEVLSNPANDPKLITGYITIPIGIDIKVGKKGKFGIGGYGGYRVNARQVLEYKTGSEKVEENRRASYGLNDIVYGASAKIGVGGLTLTGRYNFSPLFDSKNTDYKYNTYMLGLSFGF